MRTVLVMSLLQRLQMYFTPPPEEWESDLGAPLAFVMRPMVMEEEEAARGYRARTWKMFLEVATSPQDLRWW